MCLLNKLSILQDDCSDKIMLSKWSGSGGRLLKVTHKVFDEIYINNTVNGDQAAVLYINSPPFPLHSLRY